MKPNFALILSSEVIGLLHRTAQGWTRVGDIATDSPDLETGLDILRSTARELAPEGFTTKLILPQDQVLFTEVSAPGPEASQRKRQIRRALEGLTPYAVDELVFDWWGAGAQVQVAVVARETLEEAETFAEQFGFNPVSFVTIPPSAAFAGEPFFGQAKGAGKRIGAGGTVTRDQDPVKILDRAPQPAAPVAAPVAGDAAPVAEAAEPVAVEVPAAAAVAAEAVAEAAAPVAAEKSAVVPAAPVAAAPDAGAPDADAPVADAPAADAPVADAPDADAPAADAPVADAPVADASVADLAPEAPPAEAAPAAVGPVEPAAAEAPFVAIEDDAPETAETGPVAAVTSDYADLAIPAKDLAAVMARPAPAAEPVPAFSSRRRDDRLPRVGSAVPPPADASGAGVVAPVIGAEPPRITATIVPLPGNAAARSSAIPATPGPAPRAEPAAAAAALAKPGRGKAAAAPVTAQVLPVARKVEARTPAAIAASAAAAAAAGPGKAAAKAVPGIGSRGAVQRGKPRYLGLILTGVLLLFLFLIAAWSSIYLAREDAAVPPQPAVAGAPEPAGAATLAAVPDTAEAPLPEGVDPEAIADGEAEAIADGEAEALADGEAEALADGEAEAVTAQPVPEPVPEPAGPAPATAAVAEAPAPAAPDAAGRDEIVLAAIDPAPPVVDPLALPPAAAADAAPAAAMPPPPPGTVYSFDADGRIEATAEGVVTPDGVWLIVARPPLVPPPRPADAALPYAVAPSPEAAVEPGTPEAPEAAADAASPFQPDPTAAGLLRPRARPAGLVPPQQAEDDTGLIVAPVTDTRLATLRPAARPAALVAAVAEPAPVTATDASLVTAAADPAPAANPLAVSFSRRPAARPRDFSAAVEVAVAAAVRPADPVPEARPEEERETSNPSLSEEERAEDDGDEPAAPAPRIPSSASVAKQATFANAINLSKINLIGIYGTSANRHALVRLASGRYVKVGVGDRVDGGKVAAITTSELRYQKGGRLVTLAMPKG
jgi:hypothetical protein